MNTDFLKSYSGLLMPMGKLTADSLRFRYGREYRTRAESFARPRGPRLLPERGRNYRLRKIGPGWRTAKSGKEPIQSLNQICGITTAFVEWTKLTSVVAPLSQMILPLGDP